MQKISLKKIHFHIDIERVPTLTLYAALSCTIVFLLGAAWFSYRNVYVPYMNNTIPEEKLDQKQDKLNVKDFSDVRAKLEAKQKSTPNAAAVDPFQTPKP
ncbi:MAG: hypothetical protein AAB549_02970 [Patescibacteria group bacterium]